MVRGDRKEGDICLRGKQMEEIAGYTIFTHLSPYDGGNSLV